MLNVDIIKPGLFTTVQDGGRKGYAFYGIPASGFMDTTAAHIANILVGNKKNGPLLEMNFIGGVFSFDQDCVIAITGADMQASINGDLCKRYQTLMINKGEVVHFKNAIEGVRGYMAINGTWKIPEIYKSKSTLSIGAIEGFAGAIIKKNSRVNIQTKPDVHNSPSVIWPQIPDYSSIKTIEILKGPEYTHLKTPKLLDKPFSISPQSDRMGAILDGPILEIYQQESFNSKFLMPGMIQCTPTGKLIVVLQDGQTTGGYPRVGIIPGKELDRFNQLQSGVDFKFRLED